MSQINALYLKKVYEKLQKIFDVDYKKDALTKFVNIKFEKHPEKMIKIAKISDIVYSMLMNPDQYGELNLWLMGC